jgi:hypothetical protein
MLRELIFCVFLKIGFLHNSKETGGRSQFRVNLSSVYLLGILIDLGEVRCGDVDWIGLAHDRNRFRAFVNSVWNLWVL